MSNTTISKPTVSEQTMREQTFEERINETLDLRDTLRNAVKNYHASIQKPDAVSNIILDSVIQVEGENDGKVYFFYKSRVNTSLRAVDVMSIELSRLVASLLGMQESVFEEPMDDVLFVDFQIHYTVTSKSSWVRSTHDVEWVDFLEFILDTEH